MTHRQLEDGLGYNDARKLVRITEFDYQAVDESIVGEPDGFSKAAQCLELVFQRLAFDRNHNLVKRELIGERFVALMVALDCFHENSDLRSVGESIGSSKSTLGWWEETLASEFGFRRRRRKAKAPPDRDRSGGGDEWLKLNRLEDTNLNNGEDCPTDIEAGEAEVIP